MIRVKDGLKAIDLFCGGGGTTAGAAASRSVDVRLAVNHWTTAVLTHQRNHPDCRTLCADVDQVNPIEFRSERWDVLYASPECVFHSVARGGRPVDDQRRSSAWCVPRWVEALRPRWFVIENVREFVHWGPLGIDNKPLKSRRGEIFEAWIGSLRSLGYHVEWRVLNAADYGVPQKRQRLFILGRRGRSERPIRWPEPTHVGNWRGAWEFIDWSLACPSIFTRKRPLADKTLARIEVGLRKFCTPEAVAAFLVKLRNKSTVGSVTTPPGHGAGQLVLPWLLPNEGIHGGNAPRAVDQPAPTITAGRGGGQIVLPFLTKYNGTGGANEATEPLSTCSTRERHGLAMVRLVETMQSLGIADIGFRMLVDHELAAAQSFERDYWFAGTKTERIKQIGNAVPPRIAEVLSRAIAEQV